MVTKVPKKQRAAGHQEATTKLAVSLSTVDFPATRDELEQRVGETRVPLSEDVDITLREMLGQLRQSRFGSASNVMNALEERWQTFRAEKGLQEPPPDTLTKPGRSGRSARSGRS